MDHEEKFPGSVLRMSEARAKPGCVESLVEKFATTSVKVVLNQPGNQGHFLRKHIAAEGDVLVFVSVWKDMDAIKTLFGEDWESSYLPPGCSDLIEDCSVKHVALETDWPS